MNINNKAELDAAIAALERKKIIQESELVDQFRATRASLNPLNMIKSSLTKLSEMPIGEGILKTAAGLGVGMLSKRLVLGSSGSLIKKIIGPVLEFMVAKTAINNVDKIKAYGTSIYHSFFKKNSNHHHNGTDSTN